MKLRGKIDRNQAALVKDLRGIGASVLSIANMGKGAPDLLVGFQGRNVLLEVKNGSLIPSKKRLTPDEKLFHDNWRGQIAVIETTEEALKILRAGDPGEPQE